VVQQVAKRLGKGGARQGRLLLGPGLERRSERPGLEIAALATELEGQGLGVAFKVWRRQFALEQEERVDQVEGPYLPISRETRLPPKLESRART